MSSVERFQRPCKRRRRGPEGLPLGHSLDPLGSLVHDSLEPLWNFDFSWVLCRVGDVRWNLMIFGNIINSDKVFHRDTKTMKMVMSCHLTELDRTIMVTYREWGKTCKRRWMEMECVSFVCVSDVFGRSATAVLCWAFWPLVLFAFMVASVFGWCLLPKML